MKETIRQNIRLIEWLLGAAAVLLPVIAWMADKDLGNLTIYEIFPPLGLIAFGVMWTHFVMGALRRYSGATGMKNNAYLTISMGVVLALIVLHPGLFWLALYLDGYGLPPQSYTELYATQLGFLMLGTLSLMIFLAYELKRWFGNKGWWKYVELAQIAGMIGIYVHALGLGNELASGWFSVVWVIYGITFVAAVVYSRFVHKKKAA